MKRTNANTVDASIKIVKNESNEANQFLLRNESKSISAHLYEEIEDEVSRLSWEDEIKDIDDMAKNQHLYACEYAEQIMRNLRTSEKSEDYKTKDYMSQRDFKESEREQLVDWLVLVSREYNTSNDTIYMAVNFFDRYMSQMKVPKPFIQLIGIMCFAIASKQLKRYGKHDIKEYLYICDNQYKYKQAIEAESSIVHTLKWKLLPPITPDFLRRFLIAAECERGEIPWLAQYILELTLYDYNLIKYLPSTIAASIVAICLANYEKKWTPTLKYYTNYDPKQKEMQECIHDINEAVLKYQKQDVAPNTEYSKAKHYSVSSKVLIGTEHLKTLF